MTNTQIHRFAAALCIVALLAGCSGGDGPTGPDPEPTPDPVPEPTTTTLVLDFHHIEVIKDCDGAEGDGDFEFRVTTASPTYVQHYYARPNLGPGGKTPVIGRQTYRREKTWRGEVAVNFIASEWDRDIFGTEWTDDRMSELAAEVTHVHRDGVWSNLGSQTATLGSGECQVRLVWTATVATSQASGAGRSR